MLKKIFSGTDNFYKLITESDFVIDKSLFIKEIIEHKEESILITRPRRWGKSMNLDMLRKFLNIEVDKFGKKLNINPYKILFEGGKIEIGIDNTKLLNKLNIAKIDGDFMQKQGKYPVIFLNLKDCKGYDFNTTFESIRVQIQKLYRSYEYLITSTELSDITKQQFYKHASGDFDYEELKDSLSFLSELLFKHYNKMVWILVDEHDKPGIHFLTLGNYLNLQKERDRLTSFITSMFARCGKGNEFVYKMVLTGVTDFIHRETDSGFNNLSVYGMRNFKFIDSYGLSLEEVKYLVKKVVNKALHKKVLNKINEWYNGYYLKNSSGIEVCKYNIWSVIKHLSEFTESNIFVEPKCYWTKTGVPDILRNINNLGVRRSFVDELIKLSNGEEALIDIPPEDFEFMANIDCDNVREQLIVYLLMQSGYLNIVDDNARLPNLEVSENVRNIIIPIWARNKVQEIYGSNYTLEILFENLCSNLPNLQDFINYLDEIINRLDAGDRSEFYFSGLIGGIIEAYNIVHPKISKYKVLIEKNVGRRRIDNIFYPTKSSLPLIIHEYKKSKNTITKIEKNSILDDALWQIIEKNYLSEPISKIEIHNHYKFKNIIIRAVLFVRDENTSNWSFIIKEKEFNLETAFKIIDYVKNSSNINELKNIGLDQFINNLT